MKLLCTLLALLLPSAALAGDLNAPALPFKAPVSSPCTLQGCSGFYLGVGLSGTGTNADIVGNGVNGSVFAAGGIIDVHGGYQLWNGQYFAAFEGGIGNQFQPSQPLSSLGAGSLVGYEKIKLGLGLTGLFNQPSGTPASGQAPAAINIPASIAAALISPYLTTGAMQRNGVSQWISGAGAEFLLASHWNLNLEYVYGAPVSKTSPFNGAPPLNLVTLGLNYHF